MGIPYSGKDIFDYDIFDTFRDYFVNGANANIVYGTNVYHFADLPQTFKDAYGGSTSGIPQGAQSINGINPREDIVASEIRDYVIGQAVTYCRIRKVSVTRRLMGDGGAVSSQSTNTGISNMISNFAAAGFSNPNSINNISPGNIIYASQIIQFVVDCYNQYNSASIRDSEYSASYDVCHTSCHSNCHRNRGRR